MSLASAWLDANNTSAKVERFVQAEHARSWLGFSGRCAAIAASTGGALGSAPAVQLSESFTAGLAECRWAGRCQQVRRRPTRPLQLWNHLFTVANAAGLVAAQHSLTEPQLLRHGCVPLVAGSAAGPELVLLPRWRAHSREYQVQTVVLTAVDTELCSTAVNGSRAIPDSIDRIGSAAHCGLL